MKSKLTHWFKIIDCTVGVTTVENKPVFAKFYDAIGILILIFRDGFQAEITTIVGVTQPKAR